MLKQLSNLMQTHIRKSDVLARLGGDEFALLLLDCDKKSSQKLSQELLDKVQHFCFQWDGKNFEIGLSAGMVYIDKNTPMSSLLMNDADNACYIAKEKGRNQIYVALPGDSEVSRKKGTSRTVQDIKEAMAADRLVLYAQEIRPVNKVNQNVEIYEILIRMRSIDNKLIPPMAFIPIAERYHFMNLIDRWVVENAIHRLDIYHQKHNTPDIHLHINLSGQSISDAEFCNYVCDLIKANQHLCHKLCFELTESAAVSNLRKACDFMADLKSYGCKIALDDFGSGLSSFGYLKNIPVDILKIDGKFVKGVIDDPVDFAMIKAIQEVANIMQLETVAEYVENKEILEKLAGIGIDLVQGYGIGKPFPLESLFKE
ncbi:MAG: EAL domain-containing protein [Deltaproteobacteria bacterium]|nr:EAL domain-containing protein [Deltaproteobacteria bacterium]